MSTVDVKKSDLSTDNSRLRRHSESVLLGDERELYELACLSGVLIDPRVFKIIVDLIRLNVSPGAIVEMLKSISGHRPQLKPKTSKVKAVKERRD